MLGRLEMDIDECINTYTNMFKNLFGKTRLPVNFLGRIKGRFDSVVLEECVQEILKQRGLSETEPLSDEVKDGCKVLVELSHIWMFVNRLNIGLSVQRRLRSQPQFSYDPIRRAMLLAISLPQFVMQYGQRLRRRVFLIRSQLAHMGENL